MDELVQHCLTEIAFEGELGCGFEELKRIIESFYELQSSVKQAIDNSYCSFLFSIILQQPSVKIGKLPDGPITYISVPPQVRVGKRNKGVEDNEPRESHTVSKLEDIPDATSYDINVLIARYGEKLRVAVDPEAIFVVLAGSHARPAKLTPVVYAALQVIGRAREPGISAVDLGKATGYDQKTIHYLVGQLVDLNLVVKLRRGGNSQNFCVHKHYFDSGSSWKAIRDAENRAKEDSGKAEKTKRDNDADCLQFDPIDTLHLTSLPILRQRILKLLKHSEDGLVPYVNIALRVGFHPRDKSDRRFFLNRLRELISEGEIEKVSLPNIDPDSALRSVYIRLVKQGSSAGENAENVVNVQGEELDEEKEEDLLATEVDNTGRLAANVTFQKQILDLVERSGSTGITLQELAENLGHFDKRSVDQFLDRTLKQPPPPHLADLSIIQLNENYGKEKRYRYFTLPSYIELMAREKFKAPTGIYSAEDVDTAGSYSIHSADEFYLEEAELFAHLMQYRPIASNKGGRPRKEHPVAIKSAAVHGENTGEGSSKPKKVKEKKEKKEKVFKNPVLADGTRKRGRPVKDPEIAEQRRQKRLKIEARKKEDLEAGEGRVSTRKTRGKRKRSFDDEGESEINSDDEPTVETTGNTSASEDPSQFQATVNASAPMVIEPSVVRRKRGRPPKKPKIDGSEKVAVNTSTPVVTSRNGSESLPTNQFETILEAQMPTDVEIGPIVALNESVSDVPYIETLPEVDLDPSDGKVATKSAMDDNKYMSDFETDELGPVGKLVPASFEQYAEQVLPFPFVPDWQNLAQNAPDTPMSPLTELADDGPVTHSAEDQSDPEMSLFEEMRSVPIAGMPDGSSNEPVQTTVEVQSAATQAVSNKSAEKESEATSISSTKSVPKKIDIPRQNTVNNISQIRRENEFVRLIENSGGIINTSTLDFFRALTDLLEAMTKAGEPTSAPVGTQIDRRTMNAAFNNLVSDGRIKLLTTSVRTATSSSRLVKIAHLPHISEEDIRKFLSKLGSPVFDPKGTDDGAHATDRRAEMDPNGPRAIAKKWVEENLRIKGQAHFSRDPERVQRLFELDDEIIREALRLEKQTASQIYGFLLGILMRARALHVHIVEKFGQNTASQFIVASNRVVDWEYFETDVPLSVYSTYMTSVAVIDEFKDALETEEGQRMRVRDAPVKWQSALRAGKAGSRDRIFELLEVLKALKIATPLRVSSTTNPLSTNDAMLFEFMPPGWESEQPPVYPRYWQFTESAPVFLTALREVPPPLHRKMPLSSKVDVLDFWDVLQFTSTDEAYCERQLPTSQRSYPASIAYDDRMRATLARSRSWKGSYCLSWHQCQFLDKHFDSSQSSEVCVDLIARVAHIISAPSEVVRKYVVAARGKRNDEIMRIRLREEQLERKKQEAAAIKALLDAKSKEATQRRELEWKTLLEKVCDGPDVQSTRLKRLRHSFVMGRVVQDTSAWENQIKEALRAAVKTKKLRDVIQPGISQHPVISASAQPVRMEAGAQPTQMVVDLRIDTPTPLEKPKIKGKAAKSHKKKGLKEDSNEMRIRSRKTRYHWSEDDDELARDAYAIIQARCRCYYRVDYGAFAQLFKDISSNTVRQHIGRLKEKPGAEGYLRRLEAAWMDLWSKHRGTADLPDDNPADVTDFDLLAHIMFLRKHIDKDALRLGISIDEETAQCTLPLDLAELLDKYEVLEQSTQTGPDILNNASTGEEAREKLFLQDSIVLECELQPEEVIDDQTALAESALKVVIGTPIEDYDPHCAADILNFIGDERVAKASSNLLSQNVFSKLVRDPDRLAPGRSLKISEANQNALGGPVSRDLIQDAVQSARTLVLEQNEWREWPLMSTDGDTAALLQLFSDHKFSIKFDMDQAQRAIASLDGNSRKADDNDLEIQMEFRLKESQSVKDGISPAPDYLPQNIETNDNYEHGKTVSGNTACCGLYSEDVVDCVRCIEDSLNLIEEWKEEDQKAAREVLNLLESQGSQGITAQKLKTIVGGKCMEIIKQLHSLPIPVVYPVGYHTSVLVSAKHVSSFTIILPQTRREELPSISKCFPRRWLDIKGNRITEVWEAALRSVVGLVHLRPGISHADLRQRLKPIYDRQEVMDLTLHLSSNGHLICRTDEGLAVPMLKAATEQEERTIHWLVDDQKHWFMAK